MEALFNTNTRVGKLGLFVGSLLILSIIIPTRWGLKGPCEVRPALKRALAPLERGVVVRIYKKGGDSIRKGEFFAKLDDFELQKELANLRIEEQIKEERYRLLGAQYGSALTQAETNLAESKLAVSAHQTISPYTVSEARNAMEEAESKFLKAKTHYQRVHEEYLQFQKGAPPDRIAQVQEELNKAQAEAGVAQKEWARYQILGKEELASPKEIEEKKLANDASTSEMARFKNKLNLATRDLLQDEKSAFQEYRGSIDAYSAAQGAYYRISEMSNHVEPLKLADELRQNTKNLHFAQNESAEIEVAKSELEEVKEHIRADKQRVTRTEIRSPIDGIIMTPQLLEWEGKLVGEGQPMAWVYAPGPMIFEIRMDELDVAEVPREYEARNDVVLRLLSVPGESFHGKVRRIIPESLANPHGKAYLVDVEVDDKSGKLLPGMQGTGKVYGRWHPMLWQVIRRPVKYVFWKLWSLF